MTLRPKHNKQQRIRVFVRCGDGYKWRNTLGYKVGKHFAVAAPLPNGQYRDTNHWAVTHLGSGAKAAYPIKSRRIAEIICRVLERGPTNWQKVSHADALGKFDATTRRQCKKSSHLAAWIRTLEEW